MLFRVYHGSNVVVEHPDLKHSNPATDFGLGFYVTGDVDMAERWAAQKKAASIINVYSLDDSELTKLNLVADSRWLDYILDKRLEHNEINDLYDLIIGPTADDRMFRVINAYMDKDPLFHITRDQVLQCISAIPIGEQIALKSEKALECLTFNSFYELDEKQIDGRKQETEQKRNRINQIIDEFLRTGQGLERLQDINPD